MKRFIALLAVISLTSCVTSAVLISQNKCTKENRDLTDQDQIDCPSLPEVVDAAGKDVAVIKEAGTALKNKYQTDLDPTYLGEDSNLCKATEEKICSVKEGCVCHTKLQ